MSRFKSRMSRDFEEWKQVVSRVAPAVLETLTEKQARYIFEEAYARGEQNEARQHRTVVE